MNLKDKLFSWSDCSALRKNETIFFIWVITAILYAFIKFFMGKYNNYKIFKGVFGHTIDNMPLYAHYPGEYCDNNHYGILFSAVIAPFAVFPDFLGVAFWVVANTVLLFYAIGMLPLRYKQKLLIYWFSLCELMTAQAMQQFNISIVAIIILSFVFIEKKRDFWAAFFIVAGTLIKIYPIAGLAFFFFSEQKAKLIASLVFWTIVLFLLPVVYTSGLDYVVSQYSAWFAELGSKYDQNMFSPSQNVSLLGIIRKISGDATYSDMWIILPGLLLFSLPYFRTDQYKCLSFRMMLLANILLFIVLFSTGSEASGYIIAMTGVSIWYICTPSKNKEYKKWLLLTTLIIVAVSSTELVPSFIRDNFLRAYAVKAWPCVLVWLTICYEMIFLNFDKKTQKELLLRRVR
ncbi:MULTISPECIES: glycosyltransferase family 87 protein [unclassified Dysgonomonas]|jgi:hypothetical protein|uniref:glycosyltransferase family 87 protein n=1 Tax=unclassified Dysgonomonas TaxID=2630389 RepID=UPI0025BCD555|nr:MULTISPECIES: glycosyltransferase family 87 protein [unclassified Dysgonomonas]